MSRTDSTPIKDVNRIADNFDSGSLSGSCCFLSNLPLSFDEGYPPRRFRLLPFRTFFILLPNETATLWPLHSVNKDTFNNRKSPNMNWNLDELTIILVADRTSKVKLLSRKEKNRINYPQQNILRYVDPNNILKHVATYVRTNVSYYWIKIQDDIR